MVKKYSAIFLRSLIGILYAIKLLPIRKAIRLYDRNADTVIMMYYPKFYFITDFALDLVLLNCILNKNKSFSIKWNKKINIRNKTIFLNLSDKYAPSRTGNYVQPLISFVRELEQHENDVHYHSDEIEFWENKARMHELFQELDIRTPYTQICDNTKEAISSRSFEFPLLVKDEHSSGSRGVYKVNNESALHEMIYSNGFQISNRKLITQQLLNMHRDLRVILVGDQIVLHYWRFNPEAEWKPTSTKHGSKVDFITFPEQWRTYIIDNFKKTNLLTGAFDVAWENDDLTTEPYFLEVSPSYDPNPNVDTEAMGLTYWEYKNKLFIKNSFIKNYIQTVFKIKLAYINLCFDQSNAKKEQN